MTTNPNIIGRCISCGAQIERAAVADHAATSVTCPKCGRVQRLWQAIVRHVRHQAEAAR